MAVSCSWEAETLVDIWLAMVSCKPKWAKPSSSLWLFLCCFVYCDSYYGKLRVCAALWTNQIGYIIVIAWLPGIYGNINHPCPQASTSDSGQFTAINPWPHASGISRREVLSQLHAKCAHNFSATPKKTLTTPPNSCISEGSWLTKKAVLRQVAMRNYCLGSEFQRPVSLLLVVAASYWLSVTCNSCWANCCARAEGGAPAPWAPC